jgi:hypothetical protein
MMATTVIARSEATKQSIGSVLLRCGWIASRSLSSGGELRPTRWLAMTAGAKDMTSKC